METTKTFDATKKDFKSWSEFFHTNGYIILNGALNPEQIKNLRTELYNQENKLSKYKTHKNNNYDKHQVHKCFFENSPTTLELIDSSILYDFAQYIIADVPGGRGNTLTAHLIHNNAFIVPPGGRGLPEPHKNFC